VSGGDVDGDGLAEVVTGAMAGGGPHVKVFSGSDGRLLSEFMAYDDGFRGGVNVAVGRVTGGFAADVITGAGPGGGPHVKVFNGTSGQLINSFMAFDESFQGGVSVAAGDVNGDGVAEIIVGKGEGDISEVKVFGAGNTVLSTFTAYDAGFRSGVSVGTTDLNGDGRAEIITGAGPGGGPHVKVFDALSGTLISEFMAYDGGFRGGVRVAGGIGASTDILTAAGPGGGPHVKVFDAPSSRLINEFMAYDGGFKGGVTVTGLGVGDNGANALATGSGPGAPTQVEVFSVLAQQPNVTFIAFDPDQRPSTGFNVTVSNDRVQPTVTITSPPSGQVGNANITVQGVVADDKSGIRTVEAQVDNGAFTPVAFDAAGNFTFTTSLPLDGSATGAHTVTIRARDKGGNAATGSVAFTLDRPPTLTLPIQNVVANQNAPPTVIDLTQHFADPDVGEGNTVVRIETNFGPIDVRLFDDQTPVTVQNFLAYVNSGRYQDSIFHRSVPNFVIQAGGFVFNETTNDIDTIQTDAPIQNEFSPTRPNKRGTIAMAKTQDPDSATSQFFINLKDNPSLDDPGNSGGFTIFGEVINDGMSVVDQIAGVPPQDQSDADPAFGEIPLINYSGVSFPFDTTIDNYVILDGGITVVGDGGSGKDQLTFSVVSNSNTNLVTTGIANDKLTLTYAPGQTGTATITVKATDQFGLSVETTFTVTVN
jgi:cyclophilin family peptidyl-prolyl cis-trans isomerase